MNLVSLIASFPKIVSVINLWSPPAHLAQGGFHVLSLCFALDRAVLVLLSRCRLKFINFRNIAKSNPMPVLIKRENCRGFCAHKSHGSECCAVWWLGCLPGLPSAVPGLPSAVPCLPSSSVCRRRRRCRLRRRRHRRDRRCRRSSSSSSLRAVACPHPRRRGLRRRRQRRRRRLAFAVVVVVFAVVVVVVLIRHQRVSLQSAPLEVADFLRWQLPCCVFELVSE